MALGSGSSGNSYYLQAGCTRLLIDAGISPRTMKKHLKGVGVSLEEIDAVFVTHDHADHIKAVGYLANDLDKPVYATQLVHEGINRNYCVSSKLTPEHVRVIQKEEPSMCPMTVPTAWATGWRPTASLSACLPMWAM